MKSFLLIAFSSLHDLVCVANSSRLLYSVKRLNNGELILWIREKKERKKESKKRDPVRLGKRWEELNDSKSENAMKTNCVLKVLH